MTVTTATTDDYGIYVDGEWEAGDDALAVDDLADGGVFAWVATADREDAEAALVAAERAQTAMADATIVERGRWLDGIADAIEAHADELAQVVVREAGKPIASARSEVSAAAERFRRATDEAAGRRPVPRRPPEPPRAAHRQPSSGRSWLRRRRWRRLPRPG